MAAQNKLPKLPHPPKRGSWRATTALDQSHAPLTYYEIILQ